MSVPAKVKRFASVLSMGVLRLTGCGKTTLQVVLCLLRQKVKRFASVLSMGVLRMISKAQIMPMGSIFMDRKFLQGLFSELRILKDRKFWRAMLIVSAVQILFSLLLSLLFYTYNWK